MTEPTNIETARLKRQVENLKRSLRNVQGLLAQECIKRADEKAWIISELAKAPMLNKQAE